MSKMVFRLLGYIGTCLGLLFLILALFAFMGRSFKIVYNMETIFYPLSPFLIQFLFAGIYLVIIGIVALSVREEKPNKQIARAYQYELFL